MTNYHCCGTLPLRSNLLKTSVTVVRLNSLIGTMFRLLLNTPEMKVSSSFYQRRIISLEYGLINMIIGWNDINVSRQRLGGI